MNGFSHYGPALLFAPADRPERFAKAAERSDVVTLDLEDAVAPSQKEQARRNVVAAGESGSLDPLRTLVRVNAVSEADFALDMQMLRDSPFTQIMLAKTTGAEDVAAVSSYGERFSVIALCESAVGVLNAAQIARAEPVSALMWGAEDLLASLGGTSSRLPSGTYRDVARFARSQVLLAAKAAQKQAIDSVYVNIPDLRGLKVETDDAMASGFDAKACIHPSQVNVVRKSFLPTQAQQLEAQELLAAAAQAGTGVFQYRGRMVDEPIVAHARKILARTGRTLS